MRTYRHFRGMALLTAVMAMVLAGTTPALAQQGVDEETIEEIEEIVVVRAPIERETRQPMGPGHPKTEVIELTRQVSFSDLDLSRHRDVVELRKRIETTAERACERLNEMFPVTREGVTGTARCVQRAVKDAEEQLQAALETAE